MGRFRQNRWHVASLLKVFKIYRWFAYLTVEFFLHYSACHVLHILLFCLYYKMPISPEVQGPAPPSFFCSTRVDEFCLLV